MKTLDIHYLPCFPLVPRRGFLFPLAKSFSVRIKTFIDIHTTVDESFSISRYSCDEGLLSNYYTFQVKEGLGLLLLCLSYHSEGREIRTGLIWNHTSAVHKEVYNMKKPLYLLL